jgi:heme-degrading monooxygenase HmoA
MSFVSITRLRLRSVRFLPVFFLHTTRAQRQLQQAPGFERGALLADRHWTFWTMTLWTSQDDMRSYMLSGSHRTVMPRLSHWCDEASVAHWEQSEPQMPAWPEADRRMRESGRASKVRHPSPHHADMTFDVPRVTRSAVIQPRG